MSKIKGTIIASTIVPSSSGDTFATHDEVYGRGGYRSVSSTTDLFSITSERVKQGMLVHVVEEDAEYRLIDSENYQTISGWERTDIYGFVSAITSGENFSSITTAASALTYVDDKGNAQVDTTKKAIDVLMYLFSHNTYSPSPTPTYTFDVSTDDVTAITSSTFTLTFTINSKNSSGNFVGYSYDLTDSASILDSTSVVTSSETQFVLSATAKSSGSISIKFTQDESSKTHEFNYNIAFVNEDGYYIMMLENYTDSWTESVTEAETDAISEVLDEYGLTDMAQSVPSLKAISRINGNKITYFSELSNMAKYEDLCTDDYDVYSVTFTVTGYFYFLINTRLTINKTTFSLTTDFDDSNNPIFDEEAESYIKIQDCSGSTVFETSVLSSLVGENHSTGLNGCYLFKQSGDGYANKNKLGIRIPKIK